MTAYGTLRRAAERCNWLAKGEQLLGYEETARVYFEMAEEFRVLAPWAGVITQEKSFTVTTGMAWRKASRTPEGKGGH